LWSLWIESLQQLHLDLPQITTAVCEDGLLKFPAIAQLNTRQKITQMTGGAHAAAWVEAGEEWLCLKM
jgi:FdhD protein